MARSAIGAVVLAAIVSSHSAAQTMAFPPAPATPAAAAAAFDARALAVIAANACSREQDYLGIRVAMRGDGQAFGLGDFRHQGEDLTELLAAKLAWIRIHPNAEPCLGAMFRPVNPDGGGDPPDLPAFAVADRAARAAEPILCAMETSESVVADGVVVGVALSHECLRRQVNESIQAMRKVGQMGSADLVCAESLETAATGDWDVNVRELVRLLYLARPPDGARGASLLDHETVDHMYRELLAARGAPSDDDYSILADCSEPAGDELGSPEDLADRHAWYNEVFSGLGDLFKWFISFNIKLSGSVLSSGAGLALAPFLLAAGEDPVPLIVPHYDIRVPETENHRLMIESSRFLTNAAIIDYLEAIDYDHFEDIKDDQIEVRDWLLNRLQSIAAQDFTEYNSRPYTRYSLEAVLNLHDFVSRAEDPALSTAAHIVLDLSASKFAAQSNRGRRIVPFRRLSENDGDATFGDPGPNGNLYNISEGADHEVARALVLSGQTQLLPGGVPFNGIGVLVNTAVSPYRLPPAALAAAVEPAGVTTQMVLNAGVELTARSPAFTVSAGGLRTGPTLSVLGFSRDKDRGVAMPTVVIPTSVGTTVGELFRFDGSGRQHERTENLCVRGGFLCGVQPVLSSAFSCGVGESIGSEDIRFINSAACTRGVEVVEGHEVPKAAPGPHFYFALRTVDCDGRFCGEGRRWGLAEIVEAPSAIPTPDPAFSAFRATRTAALRAFEPDNDGRGVYVSADGTQLGLTVAEERPEILSVDGTATPPYSTRGSLIDADGAGRATIKGDPPVVIDFSDATNPQRTP